MVESNSHFTLWKVAEELNRNAEIVRSNFIRVINMNKVSAKMMLKNLRKAKFRKKNLIRPLSKTLKNQPFE
jgi:hypothetical protein